MFENDHFLHSHWLYKLALPPIFRGLLLSRPRCNFATLILKGSAFVGTLKQSLEVSLQNVCSIDLTVRKQIQKKFTQHSDDQFTIFVRSTIHLRL